MSARIFVPVVLRFGDEEPIGRLEICPEALPPTPDYCFAIGYQLLTSEGEHRLLEICLQSDESYAAYLAKQRPGPAVPAEPKPISETDMLRHISVLPSPDMLGESKLSDPVGSDAFYSARTVVGLLRDRDEAIRLLRSALSKACGDDEALVADYLASQS